MAATAGLTDAKKADLIAQLKRTIATDPFTLSPRARTPCGIIDKPEPPPPRPQPYAPKAVA